MITVSGQLHLAFGFPEKLTCNNSIQILNTTPSSENTFSKVLAVGDYGGLLCSGGSYQYSVLGFHSKFRTVAKPV